MASRTGDTARREFLRAVLACVLLLACYYVVPVEPRVDPGWRLVRALVSVLLIVAVILLVARSVVRLARRRPGSRPSQLLIALVSGVIVFAYLDYQLAVSMPDQFAQLRTRTDALYFAVATLTTTGFGDVHAAGQLARGLVVTQQVFNLAVLATGGTALVNHLRGGQAARPHATR